MAKKFSIFSEISALNKTARVFRQVVQGLQPIIRTARAVSRAWRGTFRVGQQLGRQMRRVAFAGLAAAGAIFGLAKSSATAASDIADAADKLGIPVERYQELRFGADQANIGANNLETGLQRLNRRIVDAASGKNAGLAALLAKLGISMRDVNGQVRTSASLLPELADAFKANENAAVRNNIAFALFDSEGVDFVRLLSDGSEGLAKMSAEARRMGSVVGGTALRAAKSFDDRFSSLVQTVRAIAIELTAQLAPAMNAAARDLQVFLAEPEKREKFLAQTVKTIGELAAIVRGLGRAIATTLPVIAGVVEFLSNWVSTVLKAADAIVDGWAKVKDFFAGLWDAIKGPLTLILKVAGLLKLGPFAPVVAAAASLSGTTAPRNTQTLAERGVLGRPAPRGEMVVRFQNTPPGTVVEPASADNLDIQTDVGFSLAGAGA